VSVEAHAGRDGAEVRDRQRGQASVLLIGALLIGAAFVGLGVDGARMFTARRNLQNTADSAALAGAGAIDEAVYRESGGTRMQLDPTLARVAAERILRDSLPVGARVDVEVGPERVVVRISRSVPDTFLRVLGRDAETIGASASAEPRTP
jgi:uncharacterized membrane protein